MNRFLINLRSLDNPSSADSGTQRFSQFSIANFRVPESILGNIGEDLEHGGVTVNEDADADSDASPVGDSDPAAAIGNATSGPPAATDLEMVISGRWGVEWHEGADIEAARLYWTEPDVY